MLPKRFIFTNMLIQAGQFDTITKNDTSRRGKKISRKVQIQTIKRSKGRSCADGGGLKLGRVLTANVNKSAPNGTELVPGIFILHCNCIVYVMFYCICIKFLQYFHCVSIVFVLHFYSVSIVFVSGGKCQ